MDLHRILVPVDYSEHALRAVSFAMELAEHFGATVDAVHFWEPPTQLAESTLVEGGDSQRTLGELVMSSAEREMRVFLDGIRVPSGVQLSSRIEAGEPASGVLRLLDEAEHDLVVLATHGRTGVRHLLLGSIAEKLVRLSPVPVITLQPDELDQAELA